MMYNPYSKPLNNSEFETFNPHSRWREVWSKEELAYVIIELREQLRIAECERRVNG